MKLKTANTSFIFLKLNSKLLNWDNSSVVGMLASLFTRKTKYQNL